MIFILDSGEAVGHSKDSQGRTARCRQATRTWAERRHLRRIAAQLTGQTENLNLTQGKREHSHDEGPKGTQRR